MTDVIIIIILIVLFCFAIKSSIKHFKGEGACCGGGSGSVKVKKPRKKKLNDPVVSRREIQISGMHCRNCVNSVTNALNSIEGVSAIVSLNKAKAEVSCDRIIDENELKRAVEGAGFKVVRIT